MHIPDGFLNGNVTGPLLAGALASLSHAFVRVRKALARRVTLRGLATSPPSNVGLETGSEYTAESKSKLMRMASVGALIFAAQMINFPVANGTSGHFVGGLLAAMVLGPAAGLLVMGVILGVQALMFGDGGLAAYGANVINMGLVASVGGWYIFKNLTFIKSFMLRTGITAWITVVLAAVACSLELAFSGTIPLTKVLASMVTVHALIGVGEAMITIGCIKYLMSSNGEIEALKNGG